MMLGHRAFDRTGDLLRYYRLAAQLGAKAAYTAERPMLRGTAARITQRNNGFPVRLYPASRQAVSAAGIVGGLPRLPERSAASQ